MAAKKSTKSTTAKKSPAKGTGKSTAVRHTPIPQIETDIIVPPVLSAITHDRIAKRAHAIWQHNGGSELDNWTAAERELRAA